MQMDILVFLCSLECGSGGGPMMLQEQSLSFIESRYKKSRLNIPNLPDSSGVPAGMNRAALMDLQHYQEQLRAHAAALQAQNSGLKAYAHMIVDVPDLTRQEVREYMEMIRSTAYEMDKIIKNLLLFAEVDKADVPLGSVDMDWVVAGVQNRLSRMIKEYKAQVSAPKSWPEALGYAPWIDEVWANYISNAIEHGGQPPQVELGASPQPDGMIRFWASDNGPGIPSKVCSHLFTPYSQTNRRYTPGHGLGLSIVASIVEKLGGQVGVESELGKGSLFFFTLPARPPAPPACISKNGVLDVFSEHL
jgi:signal transduction histidine kinase